MESYLKIWSHYKSWKILTGHMMKALLPNQLISYHYDHQHNKMAYFYR